MTNTINQKNINKHLFFGAIFTTLLIINMFSFIKETAFVTLIIGIIIPFAFALVHFSQAFNEGLSFHVFGLKVDTFKEFLSFIFLITTFASVIGMFVTVFYFG